MKLTVFSEHTFVRASFPGPNPQWGFPMLWAPRHISGAGTPTPSNYSFKSPCPPIWPFIAPFFFLPFLFPLFFPPHPAFFYPYFFQYQNAPEAPWGPLLRGGPPRHVPFVPSWVSSTDLSVGDYYSDLPPPGRNSQLLSAYCRAGVYFLLIRSILLKFMV